MQRWRRLYKLPLQNGDFDEDGLALAFAALSEPGGQAFGEAFWGEAIAGFNAAVRDGERVVKVGGVGEISHAELVEPVEGAGFFLAEDEDVDGELLGIHASILAVSGRDFWLWCVVAELGRDVEEQRFNLGIGGRRSPAREWLCHKRTRGERNLLGVGASHRLKFW